LAWAAAGLKLTNESTATFTAKTQRWREKEEGRLTINAAANQLNKSSVNFVSFRPSWDEHKSRTK
jgi:hypothetical protein